MRATPKNIVLVGGGMILAGFFGYLYGALVGGLSGFMIGTCLVPFLDD